MRGFSKPIGTKRAAFLSRPSRLQHRKKSSAAGTAETWRDEDFCINPQWQANAPSNGLVEFPCTFPESFCSFAESKEEEGE